MQLTSARDQARERKRRQRARKKQEAALQFIRTDASLFLHPDRLSHKAEAPKHLLRRMALKELVDNALDASPSATLTAIDQDTFVVEDDGPGIDPEKVPILFSVSRPMMSTKLIRRPTRGAVGNGLRVVTGAAFASGGTLTVESRGTRQDLSFDRKTDETVVASHGSSSIETGIRITLRFGAALPRDPHATAWGDLAIHLAGNAAKPLLTHPMWYSEEAFAELIEAAQGTAQDVASLFGVDLGHALSNPDEKVNPAVASVTSIPTGPQMACRSHLRSPAACHWRSQQPLPFRALPGHPPARTHARSGKEHGSPVRVAGRTR